MSRKRIMPAGIRITAGKLKGRKIECPPGIIRPMTARVKEALFNILGSCTAYQVLDVFTGSGNISLEAFSRGALAADMVDGDPGKKQVIRMNCEKLGFSNARIIISDAFYFLEQCRKKYDLIMLDPPYKMENKEKLIEIAAGNDLLTENGVLVMQLPAKYAIPMEFGCYFQYDHRKYGLNKLIFYKKKN